MILLVFKTTLLFDKTQFFCHLFPINFYTYFFPVIVYTNIVKDAAKYIIVPLISYQQKSVTDSTLV